MTPALLTLSRAYMALQGAPVRDMIADEIGDEVAGGFPRFRDRLGLLWAPDPVARLAPWGLDLTDPATGGVMLSLMASGMLMPVIDTGHAYCLRRLGERFDPKNNGATLAEAVARFAVNVVGRAVPG